MSRRPTTDAWHKGYEASQAGESSKAIPYPQKDPRCLRWLLGFVAGRANPHKRVNAIQMR